MVVVASATVRSRFRPFRARFCFVGCHDVQLCLSLEEDGVAFLPFLGFVARITRSSNALVSGLTIKRFPPREKLPRSRYPIGYRSSVVTMLAAIAPTFNVAFLSLFFRFFFFFFFSRPRTIVKASTRRESGTRCIREIQKRRLLLDRCYIRFFHSRAILNKSASCFENQTRSFAFAVIYACKRILFLRYRGKSNSL